MIRYAIHRPDGTTVVTSSVRIAQDEWASTRAEVIEFDWHGPPTEIPLAAIPKRSERPNPRGWRKSEAKP